MAMQGQYHWHTNLDTCWKPAHDISISFATFVLYCICCPYWSLRVMTGSEYWRPRTVLCLHRLHAHMYIEYTSTLCMCFCFVTGLTFLLIVQYIPAANSCQCGFHCFPANTLALLYAINYSLRVCIPKLVSTITNFTVYYRTTQETRYMASAFLPMGITPWQSKAYWCTTSLH